MAERGGDVVYGGLVALGYDGDWNCLLSFKNISDMTGQSNGEPSRRITSAPSRVCVCHGKLPNCLIVTETIPYYMYPGETMTEQQVVQYNNGACKALNYTVYIRIVKVVQHNLF